MAPSGLKRGAKSSSALQRASHYALRVSWTVYVLHSRTAARTYVGIALDLAARLAQHNGRARGGARATRAGRPWRVRKTYGPFATRAAAQRAEHAVKRLRGLARLRWQADARSRA